MLTQHVILKNIILAILCASSNIYLSLSLAPSLLLQVQQNSSGMDPKVRHVIPEQTSPQQICIIAGRKFYNWLPFIFFFFFFSPSPFSPSLSVNWHFLLSLKTNNFFFVHLFRCPFQNSHMLQQQTRHFLFPIKKNLTIPG